ncbi:MAG: type II toxin-antitoxin system RelE/ParE family toxin [archaeon]
MPFQICFHAKAASEFKKFDNSIQERLKKEIKALETNPEKGKHLHYCNFWSLRIGDYRAIYEIKKPEDKIIILYLGHRKNIYSDFTKLF